METDNSSFRIPHSALTEALAKCFSQNRIVFWYDDGGKCRSEFDETEIDGVEKLVIAGNEFGIKYKVLAEKPEGKFLIYSSKSQPAPADDWLYDLYLSGVSFSTDPKSMVVSEMGFPDDEGVRLAITEKMLPFFKSEQRKRDVKKLLSAQNRHIILRPPPRRKGGDGNSPGCGY